MFSSFPRKGIQYLVGSTNNIKVKKRYKMKSKKSKKGNRVFKRNPGAKHWTFRVIRKGRTVYFNLGDNIDVALSKADEIDAYLFFNSLEDAEVEYNPNKSKGKAAPATAVLRSPTLGEIIDFLEAQKNVVGITHRTFQCYRRALYRITGLTDEEARALPLKKLTKKMIRDVKSASVQRIKDVVALAEKKRSYNTLLKNAKSVFSNTAMAYYPDSWSFEGLSYLRKEIFFNRVKKSYTLPETSLIIKTFDLMNRLESIDHDKFVIMAMALHFGMRRKEIFYAKRDWFDIDDERCVILIKSEGKFRTKNGMDGYTAGKPAFGSKILDQSAGFDFLVTDRARQAEKTMKSLLDDMRAIGWTRQSPLHELRKLYGSYIATTEGLYVAQSYLRHTSPAVTSQYYAKLMPSKDMLACWAA